MGKSAYDRHISALGDAHHVHHYFFGRSSFFPLSANPFWPSATTFAEKVAAFHRFSSGTLTSNLRMLIERVGTSPIFRKKTPLTVMKIGETGGEFPRNLSSADEQNSPLYVSRWNMRSGCLAQWTVTSFASHLFASQPPLKKRFCRTRTRDIIKGEKNRRLEQQKNAKPTRRPFHFISKVSSCTDCRGLKKNKRAKKEENKQRRRTGHQFKTGISTRESRFSGFWLLARPIPAVRHLVQPLLAGSIVAMPRNIVGHTRRDWSHGLALLFLPVCPLFSSWVSLSLGPFFARIVSVFFVAGC
jgi:hypothetical protein